MRDLGSPLVISQESITDQGDAVLNDAASRSIKIKIVQTVFYDFIGIKMNRFTLYVKTFSSV